MSSIKVQSIVFCDKLAPHAKDEFERQGYQVSEFGRVEESEFRKRIAEFKQASVLCIRSKTKIRGDIMPQLENLKAIGCYCIGTDQVDLIPAAKNGIAVFNAPFGNTRSVAELIISQIIQLARKAGDQNRFCHEAEWKKTHIGCFEIRGKTLGIVGFGHVGSQVSILAEAFGMRVLYYDVEPKQRLGSAQGINSLAELIPQADFLTFHVPQDATTRKMINKDIIAMMKPGSYLLNAARGTIAVLEDVADAIKSGHLAGAYFDVYPEEPLTKENPLLGLPNVILTPHIGGSTIEAQDAIANDATMKITKYLQTGSTVGSVNLPEIDFPKRENSTRIANIHRNEPGVLQSIIEIISKSMFNIVGQSMSTKGEVGYLLIDFQPVHANIAELHDAIDALEASILTRIIN